MSDRKCTHCGCTPCNGDSIRVGGTKDEPIVACTPTCKTAAKRREDDKK